MQSTVLENSEIRKRIQHLYLDRLIQLSLQMRTSFLDRDWPKLAQCCSRLAQSSKAHGLDTLSRLAAHLEGTLAQFPHRKMSVDTVTLNEIQELLGTIDWIRLELRA